MRIVAEGDANAFRVIAEALDPRLARFFAQLGVPEADRDDLFQETCLRLYRAAGAYDPQRPFLPWALTRSTYDSVRLTTQDFGRLASGPF